MGQCSTLPSEGRSSAHHHRGGGRGGGNVQQVSDENQATTTTRQYSKSSSGVSTRKSGGSSSFLQVHTNANNTASSPGMEFSPSSKQQQHRDADVMSDMDGTQPMDTEDFAAREDIINNNGGVPVTSNNQHIVLPQPPEIAARTRCYKLNLDSDLFPPPSVFLGPFADAPPPLTYSASSSESENATPIQVAIQTAQIFRGITVGKDGTILSQNARATRSSRGKSTNKRGEKSRQAAKIEKAKDLVEETILTGKAPESDEDAHMQSLVIMGEYDDMKYLVRDGAKKLREGTEMPDDNLLVVNRPRPNDPSMNMDTIPSSPRKRGPSSSSGSHRGGSRSMQTPRLKSHPRDRPTSTRSSSSRDVSRRHHHDGTSEHGHFRGENWGNALPVNFSRGFHSIWNCGANGDDSTSGRATSPTQVVASVRHDGKSHSSHRTTNMPTHGIAVHHHQQHPASSRPVYEGRDSSQYGQGRESGVTARAK
eukprot:CAMPEP_0113488216 /NCGR_PEP_ID=MMETSP0014_2-20120614/25903_1 /TAXON_ID=2857 /ORGANISM="Nitzschia sp." /LENGTH=478 /DNA_ID=CAMNT_0000381923 /DNA_START=596 /DNA_END=2035 /DNA_ORIENTATION=+ /assembly_acc=CAM_ASM_000159